MSSNKKGSSPKVQDDLERLLRDLTETPGPPGQEEAVREAIAAEIQPVCDDLREDPLRNLIGRVGPAEGYRMGILAHMDEVGFIVTGISDRGLIRFDMAGSIDPRMLPGLEVDLMAEDGHLIRGVVGHLSRHLQTQQDMSAPITIQQLLIDIGARSREEVLAQGLEVGTGIVFATKFHRYPNGAILAKAMDDRVGCAVLIQALKTLKPILKNVSLYGMFTCQEEIGAKGARVVAFDSRPKMTITLDMVPTKNPDQITTGDVQIGQGPVIRIFDWLPSTKFGMFTHPLIKARLRQTARKEKIPYQTDVLTSTYLDSAQVHLTAGGIPGGSIVFPRRYSHGPVELGHLSDVENGLKLLCAFIRSVDRDPIPFGRVFKKG